MTDSLIATLGFQVSSGLLAQQPGPTWLAAILESRRVSEMFAIFCFVLMVIVPCLAITWYKLRVRQWEIALKQSMVERGLSAEEICDVIAAGSAKMSRDGLQVKVRQ